MIIIFDHIFQPFDSAAWGSRTTPRGVEAPPRPLQSVREGHDNTFPQLELVVHADETAVKGTSHQSTLPLSFLVTSQQPGVLATALEGRRKRFEYGSLFYD